MALRCPGSSNSTLGTLGQRDHRLSTQRSPVRCRRGRVFAPHTDQTPAPNGSQLHLRWSLPEPNWEHRTHLPSAKVQARPGHCGVPPGPEGGPRLPASASATIKPLSPKLDSNAEEAEVEWFYEDLQDLLELTPQKDVLFIIGDWNAKVWSFKVPRGSGWRAALVG